MTAPAGTDELDRREPGTHMPGILKTLRIDWPTRDPDEEEAEAHTRLLERIAAGLAKLPESGPVVVEVPSQLSAADAEVLRPMLDSLRKTAPELKFAFFTPSSPDAAGPDEV
ncbi:hypothetical protein [Amycolatopsis sp. cg9]|uniref:hypothetical protein n=1 Tax=Amycolatopsis sp. cg9 TaxID=3238801 RepID=UPI003523580D